MNPSHTVHRLSPELYARWQDALKAQAEQERRAAVHAAVWSGLAHVADTARRAVSALVRPDAIPRPLEF